MRNEIHGPRCGLAKYLHSDRVIHSDMGCAAGQERNNTRAWVLKLHLARSVTRCRISGPWKQLMLSECQSRENGGLD